MSYFGSGVKNQTKNDKLVFKEKIMDLYNIISNTKFIGIKNYRDIEIKALSCNSKEENPNGIYFCIKGLNNDGHKFAKEAIENGAVCLVVEKFVDENITQILVADVRKAMSQIAAEFYQTKNTKLKFVGITGTNGKTTTTFIIKDILSNLGKKVGLIGTEGIYYNDKVLPNNLTTPDPINLHKTISDMAKSACEFCVMEVSAHSIALNKVDDIFYDVVALSNITKDHLDFFLNMENYVKCKTSLFNSKNAKTAVVNLDAKYSKEVVKQADLECLTIGKSAKLQIGEISLNNSSTEFSVVYNNKQYKVKTNLMGDYNVHNLCLAMGCLIELGFNLKDIVKSINQTKFYIPGRLNFMDVDAKFNVVVDYAHTPDGIKNVLKTIKKLPIKKLITVFGCGGNRDKTKRSEMGNVSLSLSDYVVVTSDNPRDENPDTIIDDIVVGIDSKKMVRIVDRKSAIEYALSIAKDNDVVAILGKGNEDYQEIKGKKIPFSDYQVVNNYFKYKLKSEIY